MRFYKVFAALTVVLSVAAATKEEDNKVGKFSRPLSSFTEIFKNQPASVSHMMELLTGKKQKPSFGKSASMAKLFLSSKGLKKKSHLVKSYFKIKNQFKPNNRKLLTSISTFARMLEPSFADAYQNTADETAVLFGEMLADYEGSCETCEIEDFLSPEEFCSPEVGIASADEEVCTATNTAFIDLIKLVAYNPWVVVDIVMFTIINMSKLPWGYILDWSVLREFLHSIPKLELYSAFIDWVHNLLKDFLYENYLEMLPPYYMSFYLSFIEGDEEGLGLGQSADFKEVVSALVEMVFGEEGGEGFYYDTDNYPGSPPPPISGGTTMEEDIQEFVHSEICYVLSLEPVLMNMVGDCGDGPRTLSNVPFCVSQEFKDGTGEGENVFELSQIYDGDGCTLTGHFSDSETIGNAPERIEDPNQSFFFRTNPKNGNVITKPCKWLKDRNLGKRESLCENDDAPEELLTPSDACPSTCCHAVEDPQNVFLRRKVINDKGIMTANIQSCGWLEGQSQGTITTFCKRKVAFDGYSPAYVACPETCGLCDENGLM